MCVSRSSRITVTGKETPDSASSEPWEVSLPDLWCKNLVRLAEREIVRLQEKKRPSLYPNESRAKRIVQARKAPQGSEALPIADARKLEEVSRICMGFHEAFRYLI